MKRIFMLLCVAMIACLSANAATITVSADITTNTTWTNNNTYILTGGFRYVKNNAILTIQAGTLIKGTSSSLVITRGAKIMAIGTQYQPIVFTSSQPSGSRNPSDWGGVLILGNAPINDPAGSRLAEGGIDPVLGLYGGTNAADNSGTMQYCRIEYAGIAYQPNNETNGLTMGGVGSGTIIDHVQVSHGGDDSFEWFGGTVNAKYLVAYRGLDDDFDTDYGFSGKVQFGVSLRDSLVADISGSNGFESDNDATGTTNTPNTNASFSNMSLFGPKITNSTSVNSNYKRAAHLRRSTQQDIYNTVFTGWVNGLKIEGTNTATNVTNGNLQFRNNILAGIGSLVLDSSSMSFGMGSWFYNATNANTVLANPTDVQAVNPYNYTAPNFMPQAGSPMLTGADFTAANLTDPFFTPVNYRGAFGTTNWTTCWTEFNPQSQAYSTGPITYLTLPVITYSGSTTFCNGLTKTLTAPAGFSSYLWSTGATTQSIIVSTSGSYSVTVTNTRGCVATSAAVTITVTPGPVSSVAVSGATTFCTGGSALLTGSTTTPGSSYQWLNNGINVSGATTAYYNATTSGNYSLKVTNSGCVGTSTATAITVNTNPTTTITGTLAICNGSATTLTATGTGLTYQWNQGGSAIAGATTNTYSATTGGSYTVDVANTAGCTATSAAVTVVATTLSLVITASNGGIICGTTPVTLTGTVIASATYQWYKNGAPIAGATTNTYSATTSGSYYLLATKSGCSVFSSSIGISAQATPTITTSATSVCAGVGVSLTASTGSTYQWYNNGAILAGATNINYATTVAGNFSVKVGACTSAATAITVNPLPTATITAGGSLSFCLGSNVVLNETASPTLAHQWKKATTNISGATNASYTANTSGSYSVKVTNTTTGCTKTSTAVTVTANAVPTTPTITRSNLTFTSNVATGNQWYKDGNAISGATNQTYTALTGVTSHCYNTRVTNVSGCSTASDTLCILSTRIGNTNDVAATLNISVVPNPNNGAFEIHIQNNELDTQAQLAIFNLVGQTIYSENMTLTTGESIKAIRLENVSNGVYFVRFQIGGKTIESKIVINE